MEKRKDYCDQLEINSLIQQNEKRKKNNEKKMTKKEKKRNEEIKNIFFFIYNFLHLFHSSF